jgi:hypothetical protein
MINALASRFCRVCDNEINEKRRRYRTIYCSTGCRARGNAASAPTSGLDLSTGSVGALAELIVASDLLRRGYDVFRALSASCSCDLMIVARDERLRVEVRSTTTYRPTGNASVPFSAKDLERSDVFAVVVWPKGEIRYYRTPKIGKPTETWDPSFVTQKKGLRDVR